MVESDNTPGGPMPVGLHYHVLTGVFLLASAVFLMSGWERTPPGQTPLFIASATCLICAMLCRVIVAIKRLAK